MSKRETPMTLPYWLVLGCAATAAGCGSDGSTPDRVTVGCERITDAECAKSSRQSGARSTAVTSAVCEQIRAKAIDDCRTAKSAGLSAATSADIDLCVQGFEQFQCSNLCGQVPQDPPACRKLSPSPITEPVTCSP